MNTRILLLFFASLPFVGFAQQKADYLKILKKGDEYNKHDSRKVPDFTYQPSTDPELVTLRKKYRLDSIAGFANETSQMLNIMHWVHDVVPHFGVSDGGSTEKNADALITYTQEKSTGVSCSELATILNDCYLSMGWKSRKVYCFPKDSAGIDPDFHVINMVYSDLEKGWIWVDPTNDAYIMDEDGNLLGIPDVRKKLIGNRPMILCPEANLNRHQSVSQSEYMTYMSKNLYLFYCPLKSEYNYESPSKNKTVTYIYLQPLDYSKETVFKSEAYNDYLHVTQVKYRINNAITFWQVPSKK